MIGGHFLSLTDSNQSLHREEYVMKEKKISTQVLVKMALMCAVSLVLLMIVRIPWPAAPFLIYDPADVPIYITSFALGPWAGLIVTFVVSFVQAFILGGDAIYGFLMHFVATGTVCIAIGCIYKHNKTKKNALIALVVGIVIEVIIMCILNYFVTAAYMGIERSAVLVMLPTIIIPFNLVKMGANSVLTFLLYKRISKFLHNGN